MASFIPLLQHFISSSVSINNSSVANRTSTTGATSVHEPLPADVSSLISLLYSYSALREWLKLILMGGILEYCRRVVTSLYYKVLNSFFINVSFDHTDASYNWILIWLSKQPSWSKTRDMQITTASLGGNSAAVTLDTEDESANEFFKSSRKISYIPSASLTYSMWYKRRRMTITRVQEKSGMYGEKDNTLHISILTRDHNVLTQLLQEARRLYMAGQEHNMCVYVSDSGNHWNHVACRAKRSMRSIVLDPGVKDTLLDDAHDFLRSKPWYAERGIPFRRGYLLYGAPGSGKTSLIHSMAGELGLDVYIVSLSRAGLDDSSLSELINALPERCVALMEDIDAAFTHGVSRGNLDSDEENSEDKKNQSPGPAPASTSRLSLSGLLNALDGVGAQEGRILFATTNKYSALDPALCRPGRMDLHIEFKNASKYQARELFNRFYLPTPLEDDDPLRTPSEKELESDTETEEDMDDSLSGDEDSTKEKKVLDSDLVVSTTTPTKDSAFTGLAHTRRAPKLGSVRLAQLAQNFADAIPERGCSMASLQGYLMSYKTRPLEAVHDAAAWVEKERAAKLAKEKKEKEDASTKKEKEEKKKENGKENEKEKKKETEKKRKEEETDEDSPESPSLPSGLCACQKCTTCGGRVPLKTITVALPSPVSGRQSPAPAEWRELPVPKDIAGAPESSPAATSTAS